MRRPVHVISSQQIWIAARERHRVERPKGFSRPLAMPSLFLLICTLVNRGQDFNEHMIAAESEGRGVGGHARGSTLELMGEQGATRRNGALYCFDEGGDAAAIHSRKPARLHKGPLAIHNVRIESCQRCFVGYRRRVACQERSQSQKGSDSTFTLFGRPAPRRHHEDDGFATCTGYKAELHGEVVWRGCCNVCATLQHS